MNSLNHSVPTLHGRRILIVDDHPDFTLLVRKILENEGATLVVVADGLAALAATAQASFDAILMDIRMPGMNGYETTQALRRGGIGIPILAVTAQAMRGDREEALGAGCSGYVTKPIGAAELKAAILAELSAPS